ncbi:hypothetical protein RHSIM_Rhsim08G0179900 [Rhododendron simsii]|uniref:WAT1-related protein n=1 Tax=Rhododendron simsii TaxID=118357 RepID=A0A834GJW1_RHOSS|nr:hypothetical protein RHSIM_Rhsim08G0179900 [Rhododendron simsii]
MELKPSLVGLVPFAAMMMAEFFDVGLITLSKAALSKGMSSFVFVVYSNALATLILLPSSFLLQRVTVTQNCVVTGISYSSPTLVTTLSNLVPAFTFLLAVVFRMEKMDLRSSTSRVKIMGTLVSLSGVLLVTLYKGPAIGSLLVQSPSSSSEDSFTSQPSLHNVFATESDWILGGLFLAIAFLSTSIGYTFQAAILKRYPSELAVVAFCCLFGTIQCTALSLFAERNNPSAWKFSLDIELLSVIYAAVFGSVINYSVRAWCIHKKGPVFVAMFTPISIAIAALFSIIFLGDTLCVGSVIGATVIVVGFYGVISAQSREEEEESHGVDHLPPSSETTPLLQTHMVV